MMLVLIAVIGCVVVAALHERSRRNAKRPLTAEELQAFDNILKDRYEQHDAFIEEDFTANTFLVLLDRSSYPTPPEGTVVASGSEGTFVRSDDGYVREVR